MKINNNNVMCFNEWKSQLLYYKKKVGWIDKHGTKHILWSRNPILREDGQIDYKHLDEMNKSNEIKFYRYILDNRFDLLVKKKLNFWERFKKNIIIPITNLLNKRVIERDI
jgi:hypothetical protein